MGIALDEVINFQFFLIEQSRILKMDWDHPQILGEKRTTFLNTPDDMQHILTHIDLSRIQASSAACWPIAATG